MAKVTIVGASSILWAPKVLGDFYVVPDQPVDEICLMSRKPAALAPVQALTALMEKQTGRRFRITTATDIETAARGADFVLVSIAVGGLEAMGAPGSGLLFAFSGTDKCKQKT
jgi:alpha-galactosidase